MGNSHSHQHIDVSDKKLSYVILLNLIITGAEFIGGLLSNSLSLISDAVHNLGDSLGLILAFVASKIGRKKSDMKYTFGRKRAEILAAFVNALILIFICLYLLKEAYERYINPEPIHGKLMIIVALIGLAANFISVILLQKGKSSNINMKAAYLHLMGDTLSSIAVVLGGIAIWLWGIIWIDPFITVVVSLYIIYHTWEVLKKSVDILMQGVPEEININEIIREIEIIDEVRDIHHLHIWQLNEENIHFEAHVNVEENINMEQMMKVKKKIEDILHKNNIYHTTLQIGYKCCKEDTPLIVEENNINN